MKCDYKALETERVELLADFTALSQAIKTFIDASKAACKSDIWTGEAEKVYYGLINNVVDNYATVSDHFNNINSYLTSVINNYANIDKKLTDMF